MGIGTSLGAFHEDDFAHIASPWMIKPEEDIDNNVIDPTIDPGSIQPIANLVIPINNTSNNSEMLKEPEGDWFSSPAQAYYFLQKDYGLSKEKALEYIQNNTDWTGEFKYENISPKEETEQLMHKQDML